MASVMQDMLRLVFPHTCPGCGRTLLKAEHNLCLHCQVHLPKRLTFNSQELAQRFYGRLPLSEIYAYLLFKRNGITQHLLHAIKYHGNQELAQELGNKFGLDCNKLTLFTTVDTVVPVPLHKSKLRLRGFNQSELIAKGLANQLGCTLDNHTVHRVKKTPTQTRKNRMERWQNVAQIFEATTNQLAGKHVLLVDDVITTGATLESCGQALLQTGVSKLSIACLAIA